MKKQYLLCFVLVLFAFAIIAPCDAKSVTTSAGYKTVSASDAKKMIEKGDAFILDVRTPAEFKAAHIKGATLIPLKNVPLNDPVKLSSKKLLPARIKEVPKKGKLVIVCCFNGGRSLYASKLLAANGYTNVIYMKGGIISWIDAKIPVVSTFVDDSKIDKSTTHSLNAEIDRVFLYLKKGDDSKAKNELDKFNNIVTKTKRVGKLNSRQASYLIRESTLIRNMI